jgi:hypothetical protein
MSIKITKPKFYDYELAYPESMGGAVFYVGKGTSNRINEHEGEASKGGISQKCKIIREIWAQGYQVVKRKVYETNIEQDAFLYEWVLINLVYGYSQLTNIFEGGNGGIVPFNIKNKIISITLSVSLWNAVESNLTGSLAVYFHCLIMLHLPDITTIQNLSQSLPLQRERGMYYGITRYVKLPLHVASRIEFFPIMQRSLIVESLIREKLGMPPRPDYHVGRPRNDEK